MAEKKGGIGLWILTVFALILILGFVVLNKDGKKESEDKETIKDYSSIDKGVGFLTKGNFIQDLKMANEVGLVFINAASLNGEIPEIIKVGFESGYLDYPVPNMAGNSDFENLNKAYLELVEKYNPYYIGLGNEIERMPDKDEFVLIYNDLYDSVKNNCGTCVVYPVFQYESFEPDLARQMKMDLLVFTSYPFMKYGNLNDIPDDYYLQTMEIANEKNVKIAFTEIGWTNLAEFKSGEEDSQVAFYNRFKELTKNLEIEFVGWGLLHGAPEVGEEWADMGLLNSNGSKKEIFYEFSG